MTGWAKRKLASVLRIQNGFAFDSKLFSPDGEMPLIRIRDLKNGVSTETNFRGKFDRRYVVQAGDFLIGMDGEFGCYEWRGPDALLNQRVCRLTDFAAGIEPRFLFYGINKYLKDIEDVTSFTTVKHLSSKQIAEIEFPFPSLEEQRRVVGMLDEAFVAIATATANAEKNLANARELLRGAIDRRFATGGWPTRLLSELAAVFDDGDWVESKDQSPDGIRLIQTGNVGDGYFKDRADKARYISDATFKRLRCTEIFAGDCLVSRLPDPVGRACIIPETGERMITAVDCTIVRFKRDTVLAELFCYFAQSSQYAAQIAKLTTGATRLRISRSNLATIEMPIPTLPEQQHLLSELGELADEVTALESIQRKRLDALDRLKQSLLHRAFSGDLTEREPLAA